MWCEQPDREREERRLMSKMPKLKTRRNEKLKNSVFSLNESSVSPMIIREKCQWQWNTRTVQYSAVHLLLHTPWLSAVMFQIISCWWRLRCNTASVTRVTRTRDTWHSQPVYLRAAQGPARHLIMLMFVRRAAYSSAQHSTYFVSVAGVRAPLGSEISNLFWKTFITAAPHWRIV